MKKLVIMLGVCALFAACDNPAETVVVEEPVVEFETTTRASLEEDLGTPVEVKDSTFAFSWSFADVFSFTNPFHSTTNLVNRKVEVLKYEGQTEDEVCRLYLLLNDKLAGSIVVYNKDSKSFMDAVLAQLDANEQRYVGIDIEHFFEVFGVTEDDIDPEHQYMSTMLHYSVYVWQTTPANPDETNVENWLRDAVGYNLAAYGAAPTSRNTSYSSLIYVDVRAIYEFAHFSDVFGLIDFAFDMAF